MHLAAGVELIAVKHGVENRSRKIRTSLYKRINKVLDTSVDQHPTKHTKEEESITKLRKDRSEKRTVPNSLIFI
jgi:hypothetical protein